jgi:hypothetical protein
MPLVKTIQKTCFVCHLPSEQIIHSFTQGIPGPSGVTDLEGRPKELTGIILQTRLEACPYCGYSAEDIGKETPVTRDILRTMVGPALKGPKIPSYPPRFLSAAYTQVAINNLEKAVEYFLLAAWYADSSGQSETAVFCRKKVISLIFSDDRSFAEIPPGEWIPILDTMRRSGDFQSVITHCTRLLPVSDPGLEAAIGFERRCAEHHDSGPHSFSDHGDKRHYPPLRPEPGEHLIIGGRHYSSEEDCNGHGWNWEADTRTLVLSGYHGSAIEAEGDITIRMDQPDNQIESLHGPGIYIRNGNLVIMPTGLLSIRGDNGGILVESGSIEIIQATIVISTKEYGMLASGTISVVNSSVLEISSETIAILSLAEGLNRTENSVLKLSGKRQGVELAGDLTSSGGVLQIESSEGSGMLIRQGSLTLSECLLEIVCRDRCIYLGGGNVIFTVMRADLNGTSCMEVTGSCRINHCLVNGSGDQYGFSISENLELSSVNCQLYGSIAISTGRNLLITDGTITASGGTCIATGGNLKYSGMILTLTGDTAMEIAGNAEISGGVIMGAGTIAGLRVKGDYFQSGGNVTVSGEAEDGMLVSGRETRVSGGSLMLSGRKTGMTTAGDLAVDAAALLAASGTIGCSVGRSFIVDKGNLKISGEEIGISVQDGSLTVGPVATVRVTGNVGIYSVQGVSLQGGILQITGQFGGIIADDGILDISGGILEIAADEYGVLLPSGSMRIAKGIIRISNSRMNDSGGCGIVVESGDLEVRRGLITVNGESYGISVPCGNISLKQCKVEAYGYRAGITGMSLNLEGIVVAYGKVEGAVVLTGEQPWNDDGITVIAGKSERTAIETVYSGQRFIHAYSQRSPDSSTK